MSPTLGSPGFAIVYGLNYTAAPRATEPPCGADRLPAPQALSLERGQTARPSAPRLRWVWFDFFTPYLASLN
jgi:hypothetical protein